ncbi:MAG TPA: hypothetical protein VGR67_10810 [Candidatus Polarisedimenticolia bacterium]|jgi:hypothetical protein|nr:hypothetical protein [Candidatus Polarisedimenticolia bacterium]
MGEVVKLYGKRSRELEYLLELYKKEHPDDDESSRIEPHLVAEWAIRRGLWKRPPTDSVELLRRDLARFLRSETVRDPQGRLVRLNHAIIYLDGRGKKRSRWYRIFDAHDTHMQASSQLRRRAALADVHQLSLDLDSWNENNIHREKLPPMDFDFNKDLDELSRPTHYPVESQEDDFDEDI